MKRTLVVAGFQQLKPHFLVGQFLFKDPDVLQNEDEFCGLDVIDSFAERETDCIHLA